MEMDDRPVAEQNVVTTTKSPAPSATPEEETECSFRTPNAKSREKNVEDANVPDTSAIKRSKKRKPRRKRGATSSGKKVEDTPLFPDGKNKEKKVKPEVNMGSHSKSKGEISLEKNRIEGLIFMCNSKTKEDCFKFHVMGMTMNRKDTVLSVRAGMKLFLYDYDLKLLYGIYRAKSTGQKNIETRAFGGAFPYQVRFTIDKECFPIADTVFQMALRKAGDSSVRKKFDVELNREQVKNLCKLFRRIHRGMVQPSPLPPQRSQPKEISYGRDVYEVVRDSRLSDRKVVGRAEHDFLDYPLHSREREVILPPQRDAFLPHRDAYLTEGPRRAYDDPIPSPPRRRHLQPEQPIPDVYPREPEREYLVRHHEPVYRDPPPPLLRQPVLVEPLHYSSSQRELQAYEPSRGAVPLATSHGVAGGASVRFDSRTTTDLYHSYAYGGRVALGDSYSIPQRREEAASASYYLDGRREEAASASYYLDGRSGGSYVDVDSRRRDVGYVDVDSLTRAGGYADVDSRRIDGGYVDVDMRGRDIDALELRQKYAAGPASSYYYHAVKHEPAPSSSRYPVAGEPHVIYR